MILFIRIFSGPYVECPNITIDPNIKLFLENEQFYDLALIVFLSVINSFLHFKLLTTNPSRRVSIIYNSVNINILWQLVESCSQIAGANLEQTTWLRRNLAVKEEEIPQPPSPECPDKCEYATKTYCSPKSVLHEGST